MAHRCLLWIGLIFLSAGMLRAQQMDLPQMINRALEENYDLRIVRNQEAQAENNNTWGNAGMLPQADLSAERAYTLYDTRQVFVTGDTQEAESARNEATFASVQLRWVVFDGLAMFARKDRLAQLSALSVANTRYFLEQTAADIALIYYQLQQERELLKAYEKTLEVSGRRRDLRAKELEVGAGTGLNLQRAEMDRNADSSLVLSQQVLIRELEIELNRLINRDLTENITTPESLALSGDLNFEDLLDKALRKNAGLNRQQIQEMIARQDVQIGRAAFFPELELFGNYNFNKQENEAGFLQSSRSLGPEYGLRVRFNLFNGGRDQARLSNAKIEVQNEELRSAQINQDIRAALHTAYMRWENQRKQLLLEENSADLAMETLEIADAQFRLGAINDVDFRLIQLSTLNARTRLLQARYMTKVREIELYRLSGQLMERLIP